MNRHGGQGAGQDETDRVGQPGDCAAIAPLLEAFYHHALEPAQAQSVAEHAAGCATCGAVLEHLATTDRLIAAAPTALLGPELRQRLATRIAAVRASRLPEQSASMPIKGETVVNDANDSRWAGTRTQTATRTERGWQRVRVLLGTAAAVLIVALLATTLLTRPHGPTAGSATSTPIPTPGQSGQTNTPTPDHNPYATSDQFAKPVGACNPARITANLPPQALLFDIAMVSPNEGWAVGAIEGSANGGPANSLILHYKNCAWTSVTTNYPGMTLMGISMVSATEGWAVGGSSDGKQLALHYSNGVWNTVTLPGENTFNGVYESVHMLSADEGWVVARHSKDQYGILRDSLLHLSNGQWSATDSPFLAISDVLPVAQGGAWVTGYASAGQAKPMLDHYQSSSWTSVALPPGVNIDRLRMVSPSDIWASGHVNAPSNVDYEQSAAVLHFDGSSWQQVKTGASGHPQFVQAFDRSTGWAFNLDQTMEQDVIGNVYYERAGTWLRVKWPFPSMSMGLAPFGMNPMQRVSADEYWTIGEADGSGQSVLLYFAGGAWYQIPTR